MDNTIQKKLAAAVSGEPLPICITNDITGTTIDFKIYQPTFAILIETSKILLDIDIKSIEDFFENKNVFKFISEHSEKILKILAINIDRKVNYEEMTFNFLKESITPAQAYDLLANIILRIGISDFQKSIMVTPPMSLFNQAELIAVLNRSNS